MTLTDIENLSATELKARKAELIEAAAKADIGELAARYVQARTDAALRDETLGTQGVTISSLNDALATAKEKLAEVTAAGEQKLAEVTAAGEQKLAEATQRADVAEAEVIATREKLAETTKSHVATCKSLQDSADAALAEARDTIDKLKQNVTDVAKERDAAQQLAKARRGALADVMKTISPVLAAE